MQVFRPTAPLLRLTPRHERQCMLIGRNMPWLFLNRQRLRLPG